MCCVISAVTAFREDPLMHQVAGPPQMSHEVTSAFADTIQGLNSVVHRSKIHLNFHVLQGTSMLTQVVFGYSI
jgi:hypothetical protein